MKQSLVIQQPNTGLTLPHFVRLRYQSQQTALAATSTEGLSRLLHDVNVHRSEEIFNRVYQ